MQEVAKSASDLEYEREVRIYLLKAFLSESSKIVIFLLVAVFLGLIKEYFAALFFLMILRNSGGGLHFNHYVSCLIVSFIFLYASIAFTYLYQPNRIIVQFGLIVCAFLGHYLVPVTSSNRPPATEQQIEHSKRNTLFIILVFFFVICFMPMNRYLYIGFWTTVLHIFQLILAHVKEGRKDV